MGEGQRGGPAWWAASVVLLGAWACGNANGPKAAVTLEQADTLSQAVASDADDEVTGATVTGAAVYPVPGVAVPAAAPACVPLRSPATLVDTDHDGIPDSAKFTFACRIASAAETDSLSGQIDVLDPTRSTPDAAVAQLFDAYAVTRFAPTGPVAEIRSGERGATRDSATLTQSETNFQTVFVFADGSTVTHVKTWKSTFLADTAGAIAPDAALPSGTWTVVGSSTLVRGATAYAIAVATSAPLHYNAACTAVPRFDAGELTAYVTKKYDRSTVVIEFTACGPAGYTVTKS